jgi:hypothetical protein
LLIYHAILVNFQQVLDAAVSLLLAFHALTILSVPEMMCVRSPSLMVLRPALELDSLVAPAMTPISAQMRTPVSYLMEVITWSAREPPKMALHVTIIPRALRMRSVYPIPLMME